MKKKIVFYCFLILLFSDCSSSKSMNQGGSNTMNQSSTTQSPSQSRPIKSAELGNNSAETKSVEMKNPTPSVRPKVEASSAKTFDAAPSVPDTL